MCVWVCSANSKVTNRILPHLFFFVVACIALPLEHCLLACWNIILINLHRLRIPTFFPSTNQINFGKQEKKNEQNQTLICCAVNVGVPNQTNKDIQYRKQRRTAIGHSFWANEGNLWWKLINTTWLGNVIQLSLNSNGNKSKENWKSKLVNRSSINERQFGLLCEFLSVSKSQRKISL